MNKLDFSVSLREKGFDTSDIKDKMIENGFEESEIPYYLKKSDEVFLEQLIQKKRIKPQRGHRRGLKMVALVLSFLLVMGVLFGYLRVGVLGLFILWGIVGYSSYRK